MLTEQDATPAALRKLISTRLIPALEVSRGGGFHIATGEPAAGQALGPTERHPFVEVCFCLEGKAELWAGAGLHELNRAHVLIIPAGVLHSAAGVHAVRACPETASSRLLWLALFPYGCVYKICESTDGRHHNTLRRLMVERHVNPAMQEVLVELRREDAHARLMTRWKLLQALVWLCRGQEHHSSGETLGDLRPPMTGPAQGSLAERMRVFIEQNFDADLDLDTIARAVSSDKSHACRVFRAATGETVIGYLTMVRVEAACRLLLTGARVNAVSRLVGIQDAYYFSRVFRRATGLSPLEYRKGSHVTCAP